MHARLLLTAAVALVASPLFATGVITSGPFTVGIGPNGELFDSNAYVGFRRDADGYDPLAPGTPRDSWGISTSAGTAYGDYQFYGAQNITAVAFTQAWGGATQTALISTSLGIGIKMDYVFAAPNVLKIHHSVYNLDGSPFRDAFLFQRDWDLDVVPTPFNENTVGIFYPVGARDSYYGFEDPDPSVPYIFPCGPLGCNVAGDLGGGVKISDGLKNVVRSSRFTYCYAINQDGQTLDGLVQQMYDLGCRHIVGTQSFENGYWPSLGVNSGAISVTAVPEPGTWALLIAGFGLVGWASRRRSTTVTA